MTGDGKDKPAAPPINPASSREQLRSWLHWLPAWLLIPLGFGPGDNAQAGPDGGYEVGYGGPLDTPGHLDGGHGDHGGGDMGGGGLGGF